MAKIKPTLNLNGTPQAVENYSLMSAHNIAVSEEGAIIPDYGMQATQVYQKNNIKDDNGILGIIVGLNSKLYIFYKTEILNPHRVYYGIDEYDEITKQATHINCAWTYHGGKITGNVTVNNTNECILNICESSDIEDIPIKHINLKKCSSTDDESIYTQNPNIPITNLYLTKTYTKNIPNGVYQFFIRYRIRDDFYTGWFPCSKECFAGVSKIIKTIQGQLKQVNTTIDSAKSFIFTVEHLFDNYSDLYEDYQIGFILSTNESMVARSWKSFTFDVTQIKFDYDEAAIEELNIEDILENNYEIFNVKNISYFRNKQYIANYKETDFNPDLAAISKYINVELVQHSFDNEGIFIDGVKLDEEEETEGGDVYYKKWGSKPASQLFNEKYLVNKDRLEEDYGEYPNSSSLEHGLYEYSLKCDFNVNPDLLWVYKGNNHNDVSNFPLSDFQFNNDFKTSNLFTVPAGTDTRPGRIQVLTRNYGQPHAWDNVPEYKRKWFFIGTENSSFAIPNGNGDTYACSDKGFGGRELKASELTANTVIENFNKDANLGEYKIIGAYIEYNNTKYFISGDASSIDVSIPGKHLLDPIDFTGTKVSDKKETNDKAIENILAARIIGVTQDGKFVANLTYNNSNIEVVFDKYYIVYSKFEYYFANPTSGSTVGNTFNHDIRIDCKRSNYRITKSCAISDRYITFDDTLNEKQYNTLLPFTEYEFYVHYVKQNGIVTNGYIINNGNSAMLNRDDDHPYGYFDGTNYNCVIYPVFSNIRIPDGYASCFFSIYKTGNDICKGFNHELRNDGYHYLDCLEADTLLYNIKDKVIIIDNDGVELTSGGDSEDPTVKAVNAEYYSSSDFTPVEMLGNSGCIRWKRNAFTDAIDYENIENASYSKIINPDGEYISFVFNGGKGNKFVNYFVEPGTAIGNDVIAAIQTTIRGKIDSEGLVNYFNTANVGRMTGTERGLTFNFTTKHYETIISGHMLNQNFISLVGIGFGSTIELANNDAILHRHEAEHPIDGDELWVKINNTYSINKDRQLIKITPYLGPSNIIRDPWTRNIIYNNYEDLNTPGYLCKVYKLNRNHSNDIYVSGTDIYEKEFNTSFSINLELYYDRAELKTSKPAYILSNYNLNYVSLNDTLNPQIRTYKLTEDGTSYMQIIKAVNSLTASFILQLESMYKNYLRKYYYVYDPNKLTQFDNTIRSSDVNTDEVYRNIYKFHPNDYYNVPVNRGPIINMFAVLNEIYVHCEHSLFKFVGNNTLSANEGEVSLKESNVFDTGITEIFDSQHGYAGISEKHHGLVTFNYYIFYDKLNKKLYAYDTQKGISDLSQSIQHIINKYNIEDIYFADDSNNNRIFVSFRLTSSHQTIYHNEINEHITLSFNFKTNSFVSIHDLTFNYSISSRLYCYFITTMSMEQPTPLCFDAILYVDNTKHLNHANSAYYALYDTSKLTTKEYNDFVYGADVIPSCVDIIYNESYEKIKVFNNVSWICNKDIDDVENKYVADCKRDKYPGHGFIIYSDQIYSNIILTGINGNDISNSYNLDNDNSFELVRYNNGIFEINYLRDETISIKPDTEVPLIHGKYFVFRMYLNKYNFRLENVTINCQNYEKA